MPKKVIVTGASGFLGSALCQHLTDAGYRPVPLTRAQYNLEGGVDAAFLHDAYAVVHCAWDMSAQNKNVQGSLTLSRACREKGVQFIFISSMAAHEAARSTYGRTKLEVERGLGTQDCIIKPGTIIGNGGLFLRTLRLAQTLPALPLFYKKTAKLQTIYVDDLCQAIVHAVEHRSSGSFAIAHKDTVSIQDFYTKIAALSGKHPWLVSMPGSIALLVTRCAEMLGLRLPITSDNLLGLKYIHYFDTQESCKALNINPLSFDESLKLLVLPARE